MILVIWVVELFVSYLVTNRMVYNTTNFHIFPIFFFLKIIILKDYLKDAFCNSLVTQQNCVRRLGGVRLVWTLVGGLGWENSLQDGGWCVKVMLLKYEKAINKRLRVGKSFPTIVFVCNVQMSANACLQVQNDCFGEQIWSEKEEGKKRTRRRKPIFH
jgi:hypothetical protein